MVSYKALNTIIKSILTYRGDTGRNSDASQATAILYLLLVDYQYYTL